MSTYTEFRSRYTFGNQGKLGEGGYGVVYRAYDTVLDRTVAIKMSPVKDGQAYTLQREVEVAGTLPMHPNIARYEPPTYRFEIEGLSVYDFALMQYYPDGNLALYVAAHKPAGEELHALVAGILSGIAFLHNGTGKPVIVHRDLKPSNILIIRRPDGVPVPKIADFGLAKASESGKSLSAGTAFTAQYMSPEQGGTESLDWRTDLWSVGSILYFLCTGQHAFDSTTTDAEKSIGEISKKVRKGVFPPLTEITEPFRSMIAACWVVDRGQRIQNATALLEMLGGAPTPPPPPPPPIEDTYDVAAAIAEIRHLRDAGQREAALSKCRAALLIVPGHLVLQQLKAELEAPEPKPEEPAQEGGKTPGKADKARRTAAEPAVTASSNPGTRKRRWLFPLGAGAAVVVVALLLWQPWNRTSREAETPRPAIDTIALQPKPQIQSAVESPPVTAGNQHLPPVDAVAGDFNGDGKPEFMWLVPPVLEPKDGMSCVDGTCTAYIYFSDPNIPTLSVSSCIGGVPQNEGDLNRISGHEVGLLPDWFSSCWRSYYVWTLINGHWKEAIAPVSTHCNQWEDAGTSNIVTSAPGEPGYVLIQYTEMGEDNMQQIKSKKIKISNF